MRGPSPTAQRALDCLEELALDKGLDGLSMRDVAKRVGISLAALQYHYPVKAELIDAFITSKVDEYRYHIRELLAVEVQGPQLPRVVRFTLAADRTEADRGSLWLMIHARAQHDETTARSLQRAMQAYLEMLQDVVQEDYPDLSGPQAMMVATLVASLLDGATSMFMAAEDLGVDHAGLVEATVQAVLAIPAVAGRPAS